MWDRVQTSVQGAVNSKDCLDQRNNKNWKVSLCCKTILNTRGLRQPQTEESPWWLLIRDQICALGKLTCDLSTRQIIERRNWNQKDLLESYYNTLNKRNLTQHNAGVKSWSLLFINLERLRMYIPPAPKYPGVFDLWTSLSFHELCFQPRHILASSVPKTMAFHKQHRVG